MRLTILFIMGAITSLMAESMILQCSIDNKITQKHNHGTLTLMITGNKITVLDASLWFKVKNDVYIFNEIYPSQENIQIRYITKTTNPYSGKILFYTPTKNKISLSKNIITSFKCIKVKT